MPENNESMGRVVLEINCKNKVEALAAIDMIKSYVDSLPYNTTDEVNQKVIVTNEGNPSLGVS